MAGTEMRIGEVARRAGVREWLTAATARTCVSLETCPLFDDAALGPA